jgi:hypothetical protein
VTEVQQILKMTPGASAGSGEVRQEGRKGIKKAPGAGCWRFMPVILAVQEAEIRWIMFQS